MIATILDIGVSIRYNVFANFYVSESSYVAWYLLERDILGLHEVRWQCAGVGVYHIMLGLFGHYLLNGLYVQVGHFSRLVIEIVADVIVGVHQPTVRFTEQRAVSLRVIDILAHLIFSDCFIKVVIVYEHRQADLIIIERGRNPRSLAIRHSRGYYLYAVVNDLWLGHFGVSALIRRNNFLRLCNNFRALRQIPDSEFLAENLHLLFLLGGIAGDNSTHTLSRGVFGIIHHFDKNEAAVSAVLPVLAKHGMSGRAASGKGVKDNTVGTCGDMEYALDEADRFRSVKRNFSAKDVFQFFFRFIGMTDFGVRPEIGRIFTFCLFQINLATNSAFTI